MSRRQGERGSVSLLVVAMVGVLVLVGGALGVVAAMVQAHRVAQAGADLAALAGAHGLVSGGGGCGAAGRIAAANHVRLTSCVVQGRDVTVTVEAPGPRWLGQTADLSAQARAGPA